MRMKNFMTMGSFKLYELRCLMSKSNMQLKF